MKKVLGIVLAGFFLLGIGLVPEKSSARLDPEIKKYQKELKKKRKEEKKKERQARRKDKNRRLRPYHTLEELYAQMDELAQKYPELVEIQVYGKSVEGRELRAVKISTGAGNKPEILFSANIHAQELAGAEFCMALLKKLLENYGSDCYITYLLDNTDVYVIPVLNPDGNYKASRMQAKYGITGFIRKNKNKIDLNRNFPYPPDAPDRLKDSAGSKHKWMPTYRGPKPLSEPESKALIKFIEKHNFIISMNYHTTGGMIMYPPGTFPDRTPDDELFEKMAKEYQALQFDKYKVHPEIDLYPTIGALDDYIYHRYGILPLTIEIGKRATQRALIPRNHTISPIFWTYNVYYLEREIANLMPGALNLIKWAIKLHQNPQMIKWKPPKEKWYGEPEAGEPVSQAEWKKVA